MSETDPEAARGHFRRAVAAMAQGDDATALRALEAALAADPALAEAYVNRGHLRQRGGALAAAAADYERAATLAPGLAEAHLNLGTVWLKAGDLARAGAAFRAALARRPDWPEAHLNLGYVLRSADDLGGAKAAFAAALRLRPAFADAWTNLANIHRAENRPREAMAAAQRALALAPDSAQAHVNLALAQLVAGELAAAWPHAEYRRKLAGPGRFATPAWTLAEDVAGRTVLLHAEQGLGDSLQFLRYVPLVRERGARLVLEVQPPLRALAAATWGDAVTVVAHGEPLPPFDAHCPLPSLPHAFGTTLATVPARVPYVVASPAPDWLPDALRRPGARIGIAWAGNPGHPNDRNRSLPLALLAEAVRGRPDVSVYSLKRERTADDAARLSRDGIVDLAPRLDDLGVTAAVIAELDLVITVDTAVAHLAGALGRRVWILLPHAPDWRWLLDRTDSPWYPTARLFRQPRAGDWPAVVAQVCEALTGFLAWRRAG